MNNDDEILKKLSEQIRAEMATAEAAKIAAEETRKLRVAEERRARTLEHIIERYAHLGEQVDQLTKLLQAYIENDPGAALFREMVEEVSAQADHLDRRIGLVLELNRFVLANRKLSAEEQGRLQAVTERMDQVDQAESIRRRITRLRSNLFELEEQKAKHGLTVPLDLINGIADIKSQIDDLQAELGNLNE